MERSDDLSAPAWEATRRRRRAPGARAGVSIHTSAREATARLAGRDHRQPVSIHASAREATLGVDHARHRQGVSIHASAREATGAVLALEARGEFQSTPPRGRRRAGGSGAGRIKVVSIHASAREATSAGPDGGRRQSFQSTPPRGRRRPSPDGCALHAVSIHASAREATRVSAGRHRRLRVSIHASAREATSADLLVVFPRPCFNPRLRAGGDFHFRATAASGWLFQSTPPRGRRQRQQLKTSWREHVSIHASAREATQYFPAGESGSCFNPRLRAGGDMILDGDCMDGLVSIHASAREATAGHALGLLIHDVSIHASAREATGR